ncbi:alpha/beta hydrolase [Arthrobacter russicus]|uniref:Phospholipase/carboxylesterase n=1 Tax=Arthrobacter russicus TaxID=172040 RepID=A0ABU1JBM2_9MICC|nr:phospholipase [Arthrobacter russicus]MDN5668209.1 phospholipase [Renibacterium salmoninarum]MDR6269549.1 phospholipase/carboxylesterase [Arthrobacter russicus]
MLNALWSKPESERAGTDLLVMLHGYGSGEARMAEHFSAMPQRFTCAAPRGPFEMDGEYGWFLLDYFLNNDFADVISATNQVFAWLDAETARSGFRSVSLLGHSQGMAMASTMLRLRQDAFAAVVGLSGFVLDNALLAASEPLKTKTPFFWARDVADLVINPDAVEFSKIWLRENTRLQAERYPGMGHGIGAAELVDASSFLTATLPFRPSV